MKHIITIILTILTLCHQTNGQSLDIPSKKLFPIIENGLWGYIDVSGKVIIEPKFRVAGQFSEGLAPVRLNGTYGYINSLGDFVIQPRFDAAFSFDKGIARIYINGKPYFINKEGQITFQHNYTELLDANNSQYLIAKTITNKLGVINLKGELIIDTVFKKIGPFSNDIAMVEGLNHEPYPDDEVSYVYESGVINSSGKWLINFGEYRQISQISGGYFLAERYKQTSKESRWTSNDAVLDSKGNHLFNLPAGYFFFDSNAEGFHDNVAIVNIKDTLKENNYDYYSGVINDKGEVLFSNKKWERMSPFVLNRSFAKEVKGDWWLVNKQGEILNKEPYLNVLSYNYKGESEYLFQNGIQYVETTEGWITIDTNGVQINLPKKLDYHSGRLTWRGQIIFTEKDISVESDKYSYLYGFWDTKNDIMVEPKFHNISFTEFIDELIYVMQDDRIGYIDHRGDYIWREKEQQDKTSENLNIDYMNRGYFYASSPYKKELAGFGGWGSSENEFQEKLPIGNVEEGKLNVIINPKDTSKFLNTYEGMKLYIANAAPDTAYFPAQDSRLYLNLQAKDKNGEWRDIEYLPSSWCGNSYHTLFLPPDNYWEFTVPIYDGEFKTKLRAKLMYTIKDKKDNITLYSNECEGSINPGQFWRKSGYSPSGLMDPYND